jgi:putative heme-binding domain-containing protein
VDQAFRKTSLTTEDGLKLSGLVEREDDSVLVLVDQDGKEKTLPKSDIDPDTRRVSPLSPMPANVRDLTSEQEFYDLLAYLLQKPPKNN